MATLTLQHGLQYVARLLADAPSLDAFHCLQLHYHQVSPRLVPMHFVAAHPCLRYNCRRILLASQAMRLMDALYQVLSMHKQHHLFQLCLQTIL